MRVDNTLPTSTTTFPVASGVYGATAWGTGCAPVGLCGTVADAGSGLQLVDLSFRRSSGGLYWDGTSFASATEVFNPVSLNGGNWSFPFSSASFPASGSYVLKLRATDKAGNVATFSRTFTYDLTAPNTTITSTQPASTNSTSISITFTSSESGSTFECQLDGAGFQVCTSPKSYTGLADGQHQFAVRAIDPSGNTDATPATSTWRVDTHAPVATLTAPAAGAKVSLTVTASATATDDIGVVGVQFAVDGVALGAEDKTAPYTVSWNTRLTTTGLHTISALARDAAGNTTTAQAQVRVDNNGVRGPGLLAAYSFDEGQGVTASDASGNGRTGTMVGAGWTSGKNGSAVFLDGVDDRVDLPALGTFYRTAFTFEAWVLKRGTRKDVTVLGSWDSGGPMIWVDNVNGRYMLTLGADSTNYLDSGRTPAVGTWQHVAGTWDGTTARLYIDGVEVANRTFAGDVGTSNVWRIGAFRANPIGFFDGLIDDVRIYNRALPAAEILGDMSSSVGPTDATPPTTPADLALVSRTGTSLDLSWSASTDNVGVAGYNVYRDGTLVASPTARSVTVSGLTCGTTYAIAVEAFDVAGNTSPPSTVTVSTAACDSTPPLVALVSPTDGSFVGGVVIVSATASDDGSVASVQFRDRWRRPRLRGHDGAVHVDVEYAALRQRHARRHGRRARRCRQHRDRDRDRHRGQQRLALAGARRRLRLRRGNRHGGRRRLGPREHGHARRRSGLGRGQERHGRLPRRLRRPRRPAGARHVLPERLHARGVGAQEHRAEGRGDRRNLGRRRPDDLDRSHQRALHAHARQ